MAKQTASSANADKGVPFWCIRDRKRKLEVWTRADRVVFCLTNRRGQSTHLVELSRRTAARVLEALLRFTLDGATVRHADGAGRDWMRVEAWRGGETAVAMARNRAADEQATVRLGPMQRARLMELLRGMVGGK